MAASSHAELNASSISPQVAVPVYDLQRRQVQKHPIHRVSVAIGRKGMPTLQPRQDTGNSRHVQVPTLYTILLEKKKLST